MKKHLFIACIMISALGLNGCQSASQQDLNTQGNVESPTVSTNTYEEEGFSQSEKSDPAVGNNSEIVQSDEVKLLPVPTPVATEISGINFVEAKQAKEDKVEDEKDTIILTVGSATAKKGETIKIPLEVKNLPKPVIGTNLMIHYDPEVLEVGQVSPGANIPNPDQDFDTYTGNLGLVALYYLDDDLEGDGAFSDGTLLEVEFKVKEDAKVESTQLTIGNLGPLVDQDSEALKPVITRKGTITIQN